MLSFAAEVQAANRSAHSQLACGKRGGTAIAGAAVPARMPARYIPKRLEQLARVMQRAASGLCQHSAQVITIFAIRHRSNDRLKFFQTDETSMKGGFFGAAD